MSKVGIVCDSTASVPEELIEQYGIRFAPFHIIWGGRDYRERIDMTATDFYKRLRNSTDLPTSSGPSPKEFSEVFEKLREGAGGVACVLMSSLMTRETHNSAFQAKETLKQKLPDLPIEIVDSRTVMGALGLIVLAAARAASQGEEMAEVINVAESVRSQVNHLCVLDTLKYLARGGRVGKAASWAANMLNIKPIIGVPVSAGIVMPVERVRTKHKGLERMVSIMMERVGTKPVHVIIDHCDTTEEAEWLKSKVSAQFNCLEIYVVDASPIVGVHPGPGTVGLAFYAES